MIRLSHPGSAHSVSAGELRLEYTIDPLDQAEIKVLQDVECELTGQAAIFQREQLVLQPSYHYMLTELARALYCWGSAGEAELEFESWDDAPVLLSLRQRAGGVEVSSRFGSEPNLLPLRELRLLCQLFARSLQAEIFALLGIDAGNLIAGQLDLGSSYVVEDSGAYWLLVDDSGEFKPAERPAEVKRPPEVGTTLTPLPLSSGLGG